MTRSISPRSSESQSQVPQPPVSLGPIQGWQLKLRTIEKDDATYLYSLRTNAELNVHLSAVTGTAADQARWIESYKEREARCEEIYFLIERLDGVKCGTVRLYDLTETSFTWGSWILDDNKPSKAALESAFLLYQFAFSELKMREATFSVRIQNVNTIAFHLRFGAQEIGYDDENRYFIYPHKKFISDLPCFEEVLSSAQTGALK